MEKTKMNDDQLDGVTGGSIIPYQVEPGDTLTAIAGKFNVSVDQLVKWNNIKDQNMLMVGQQLKVKF